MPPFLQDYTDITVKIFVYLLTNSLQAGKYCMLMTQRIMKLFAAVGIVFLGFEAPAKNFASTDNGLPPGVTISSIAWSPDGTLLATGHYAGYVRIWRTETEEITSQFESGEQPIYEIAWDPHGSQLAGGSYDGTIRVWNISTGQLLHTLATIQGISGLTWSLDGTKVIGNIPEGVNLHIWDAETGELLGEIDAGAAVQMTWSPDGLQLAMANPGGFVDILNATTFERVDRFQGPEPPPGSGGVSHGGEVTAVAWNPEGTLIASGSLNGSVRIWDLETGQILHEFRGNYYPVMGSFTTLISSVHITPDGSQLISVSADGTIRGWEAESGRSMFYTQENERISAAAWSPDGCRLAYGINTSDRRNPDADENLYEILSFCEL